MRSRTSCGRASPRWRTGPAAGAGGVLVGHNPASEIYVRNKMKACQDLGIYSETLTPPDSATTEEVLNVVGG